LLVEGRVAVETDGITYHGDETAFEEDRRRDRACLLQNVYPARFTRKQVLASRGDIARQVKAMLAALD
jgi:very-short-patch-repair endonuclease